MATISYMAYNTPKHSMFEINDRVLGNRPNVNVQQVLRWLSATAMHAQWRCLAASHVCLGLLAVL